MDGDGRAEPHARRHEQGDRARTGSNFISFTWRNLSAPRGISEGNRGFRSRRAIGSQGLAGGRAGLLYRADCHARLGDEAAALAYCARLPDDFWTPGVYDAPAGSKAEIADELRRIAAKARGRGP